MRQDIRYTFRVLKQNRAFAAVAISFTGPGNWGRIPRFFTLIDKRDAARRCRCASPEQLAVLAENPDKTLHQLQLSRLRLRPRS